jgi:dTMP kinase
MNRFLTFEGVEGSGKSTQAAQLARTLEQSGYEVVTTREPGGTDLGRQLRSILLAADTAPPAAETELLLYLADRAEHVTRLIRPALDRGAVVIADRFSDSTLAYQAYGRGLNLAHVRQLDTFARNGLMPARTFLLDLPVEEGLARARQVGPADRLELEKVEFHNRVRDGFHQLADDDSARIKIFDAREPISALASAISTDVLSWIGDAR